MNVEKPIRDDHSSTAGMFVAPGELESGDDRSSVRHPGTVVRSLEDGPRINSIVSSAMNSFSASPASPISDTPILGLRTDERSSDERSSPDNGSRIPDPVKILLVDDHPENLLALEATLGRAGGPHGVAEPLHAEFVRARSGPEALRKILENTFAVILLDVQMPEMDGYETAELIRKRRESQYTPIIFLTAVSTSDVNIFRGYSLGAVDYITKPFDPWVLKAKVGVFVDLFRKRQEIERMADELQEHAKLLRNSNEALAKSNQTLEGLYSALEGKSEELSKERDFVDKILETAGSYIIIFDEEGRLERFNRASENVSGLKAEEARGQFAWELLVSGEEVRKVREAFERVRAGEDVSFEMTIIPNSQKQRRLLMSFTGLYNDLHQLMHVIASGTDISERYEAEEQIRRMNEYLERNVIERTKELRETNEALLHAKDAAELANSAKDKFLAVLSHELRTPLTPVLAIVQMLEEDPEVPEDAKSWVETIGRNVQLEARLIDDLLDLTRIANGKLELHLSEVDLHKLIRETLEICSKDIDAKHLKVSLLLGVSQSISRADSARIQQVLWNLLKNAIKFTPEGGSISIRTYNTNSGALRCQIRDTGIGIPKDHLDSVFHPFDQGSKDITRRFGGLGLGLAISKALIEQHQGSIWAESDGTEQGSTFTIEIPTIATPVGKVLPPRTPEELPAENVATILLVEDNDDTSRAMQVLFERKGYHVTIARSVQDAVSNSQNTPFDLVVSDIGLPDGDGFEVIRRLKAIHPIRGIAISGFGMDEDRRRSREAGFDAHLVKPINFAELTHVVQQLLPHA